MNKRIIIALGYGTLVDRNAVTRRLQDIQGLGWWHHLPDLWLVAAPASSVSVSWLASEIRVKISPRSHLLVFDVDNPDDRTGWLDPKAWDWLRDNWQRPSDNSGSLYNFLMPR